MSDKHSRLQELRTNDIQTNYHYDKHASVQDSKAYTAKQNAEIKERKDKYDKTGYSVTRKETEQKETNRKVDNNEHKTSTTDRLGKYVTNKEIKLEETVDKVEMKESKPDTSDNINNSVKNTDNSFDETGHNTADTVDIYRRIEDKEYNGESFRSLRENGSKINEVDRKVQNEEIEKYKDDRFHRPVTNKENKLGEVGRNTFDLERKDVNDDELGKSIVDKSVMVNSIDGNVKDEESEMDKNVKLQRNTKNRSDKVGPNIASVLNIDGRYDKLDKLVRNKSIGLYEVSRDVVNPEIKVGKLGGSVKHENANMDSMPLNQDETELTCELGLEFRSITRFRHLVYYGDLNFVILHLKLGDGLEFLPSRNIVGESHWVWTFYGRHGGLEFLDWPLEFHIWSLGLLNAYVGGPMDMYIDKIGGDCSSLQVGNKSTDLAISNALVNLTYSLHFLKHGQYDPSFWCYRKRKFLNPNYLYWICKHIVCPCIAIKYSCCAYYYSVPKRGRQVECEGHDFKYDEIWWLAPIFAAVVLFSFFPLFILNVASTFKNNTKDKNNDNLKNYIFLDRTDHVTLMKTLLSPASLVSEKSPLCLSRTVRFLMPFFSFTLIGIQLYLDHLYYPKYVKECVEKGVPMGFRSMVSGFTNSRKNFLPIFGGPFVACIVYLFIACSLLAIPKSLFQTLNSGIVNNERGMDVVSPLRLPFPLLERYGSLSIRKQHGYSKIYAVYVARLNLLINVKFWKFVFNVQIYRWNTFQTSLCSSLLLPLYIPLCIIETLLCVLVYGFPIISFGITVYKAYRNLLLQNVRDRIWKPLVLLASFILLMCIVFFLFMFCTIFLDTCLFITRMFIFTYTGIILYPRVSYGYLIFVATVFYYLWDSIQNFSRYYFHLLRMTVSVCESVQRANDVDPLVVKWHNFKGIPKSLYEEVIEQYNPRRKVLIVSLLKVIIILAIVGLSVHLLMKSNKFQDLHVIMHVGTTLLICAFPKIIKSLCSKHNKKITQQKARSEIKGIINRTMGFITDESDDSD